jgi:hypothetical protein
MIVLALTLQPLAFRRVPVPLRPVRLGMTHEVLQREGRNAKFGATQEQQMTS